MNHSCVFLFSEVVHESLVCPEQLNVLLLFGKILQLPKFFGFPKCLCIWTLSDNDCMILRSIFSHRGQQRDTFATITEVSNTHWCSRRKNMHHNSWKWVPQLSSVWKDGSQNHRVIVGKGLNTQTCWKTKDFVGPEGFFWKTADG